MVLGLAIMLVGCGAEPRIDASSPSAVRASLASAPRHMLGTQKRRFNEAAKLYLATYFPASGEAKPPAGAPAWWVVHKMTASDFIEYSRHLIPPVVIPEREYTDRYITESFLSQLELDQQLLEVARDRADRDGMVTIDKIEMPEPVFIPPPINANQITNDHATFVFNFTNRAAISVRDPVVRADIFDPSNNQTYRVTLKEKDLPPAPPDVPMMYQMKCCGLADDPLMNRRLKQLPETATITYTLIGLKNYGRRDVLDLKRYTALDHQRYLKGKACIADIQGREATWSIETAGPACRR